MMASCTNGRICRIAFEPRSGQVRLVSRVTLSRRSGSIQSDVPVKPRCPKDRGEKCLPDDEGCEGVSHPRAREVPAGVVSRRVKRSTVAGLRIGDPPRNMHSAKRATSGAQAKRPAWPATPPITEAFSSLTSP